MTRTLWRHPVLRLATTASLRPTLFPLLVTMWVRSGNRPNTYSHAGCNRFLHFARSHHGGNALSPTAERYRTLLYPLFPLISMVWCASVYGRSNRWSPTAMQVSGASVRKFVFATTLVI